MKHEVFILGQTIDQKTRRNGREAMVNLEMRRERIEKGGSIGSNFSRITSGTIATPTHDYIATSILHHIFIIILALY